VKYQYVIVGGGSAGCVLANRLTEDPRTNVLLIEAGGPDTARELHIPLAWGSLFKSRYDWEYYTEPQTELNGRRMYIPRGMVLGGSSSTNAMIYTRGNRYDYDLWRSMGNEGWSYDEVLPYFRRAENFERNGASSEYHGVGGPLNVSDPRYVNPLSHAFVAAGIQMGLSRNSDFSGPTQEGVGLHLVTEKRGRRHSAADAYLKPILPRRKNLTLVSDSFATRVIVEGTGHRAIGVDYERRDGTGGLLRAEAEREVILCGGAIGSPHLLMVSGIGPAWHLGEMGIEVVRDLPGVGENLQDHLAIGFVYRCTRPVSFLDAKHVATPRNVLGYLLFKRGPLTSNAAEAGAFVKSEPGLPAPDLQIGFVPAYGADHGFNPPGVHVFTIGCTFLRPKSRGHLRLNSKNPRDKPLIQPKFLTDTDDIPPLVRGLRICRSLVEQSAFDQFRGAEFPGPTGGDDDKLTDYIRSNSQTVDHPSCTCKMGRDGDPMAVVDSELRVRGIRGLRVVDASVFPTVISGNTNAPVIMIAEKAADLIRNGRS
jgi:choline dehydrogenase